VPFVSDPINLFCRLHNLDLRSAVRIETQNHARALGIYQHMNRTAPIASDKKAPFGAFLSLAVCFSQQTNKSIKWGIRQNTSIYISF
jgi:hypothetical protein